MKYIARTYILLILGLVAGTTSVYGQSSTEEVIVPLSKAGEAGILEVHVHRGKVTVEGTNNSQEVVVKVSSLEGNRDEEQSYPGGLKRIPNTSLDIRISENNNHVEVGGGQSNRRSDFVIQVPKAFSLKIHTHHDGDINISNVSGEMDLNSHHGPIFATDVSGAVVASTHHGSIQVDFNQVSPDIPMAFSTYHGDVKVNFPSNTSFSSKLKSARGDILTDFDMDIKRQKQSEKSRNEHGHFEVSLGGWVYGDINGGGEEYMFSTHHGDIIIQKN